MRFWGCSCGDVAVHVAVHVACSLVYINVLKHTNNIHMNIACRSHFDPYVPGPHYCE